MDSLIFLQSWYAAQCNGEWEHEYGIKIDNLDNPGWNFKVDLQDTDLKDRALSLIRVDRNSNDWFQCWVKDRVFMGACGPSNLAEVLDKFKEFAQ